MPFDQSSILDVTDGLRGADLAVSWVSTAPAGTTFQVYLDRRLVWHGTARSCVVPYPGGAVRVDVGAVLPSEATTDFSGSLPSAPNDRVTLTWEGGTYLDEDISGFRVYMSPQAGAAVDLTTPVAVIAAYTAGQITDGYGEGGYGDGGYGRSASNYSWTSGHLASGAWGFDVQAFDQAGNVSTVATASATVIAPPGPPARDAAGRRLTYTYDPVTHTVTLHWLASPG
jgi:hypothetical protein